MSERNHGFTLTQNMDDVSPSAPHLLRNGLLKREKRVLLTQKNLRDADLKICND